jgi:hypothetical protein
MKQLVATTSATSVGCTFVDWSINFLSGQTHMYHVLSNQWLPVVDDPLTTINAHAHKKNHPSGFAESANMIEILQKTTGSLFTFYPFAFHLDQVALTQNLDINNMTAQTWQAIKHAQAVDFNQLFEHMSDLSVKIVYIDLNQSCILYQKNTRSLHRLPFEGRPADSASEASAQVEHLFFHRDMTVWQQANLDHVWDVRERQALCMRPFEPINSEIEKHMNFSRPHLWVDCQSLWYNGESAMQDIMNFVELPIDQSRMQQWKIVYAKWQQLQLKLLEFGYRLPHMIDAIVNDWYYELGSLTRSQEAIIQHCLIYQHNLNIKSWNLDRFPANAQDLHKLLEPNIHNIEKIYSNFVI